jgi:hypothetical protein
LDGLAAEVVLVQAKGIPPAGAGLRADPKDVRAILIKPSRTSREIAGWKPPALAGPGRTCFSRAQITAKGLGGVKAFLSPIDGRAIFIVVCLLL